MKKIYLGLFLLVHFSCGLNDGTVVGGKNEQEKTLPTVVIKPVRKDGGINLAVAPGGGFNAYASIVWATEFAKHADRNFPDLFDSFWGLSGGSIAATLLMHDDGKQALTQFKNQINAAFPRFESIFRSIKANQNFLGILNDADGTRRNEFSKAITHLFKDAQFYENAGNRFVIVASADKKPVCYADASVKLPKNCIYRMGNTAVSDGIINSCNFQLGKDDFQVFLPPALKAINALLPEQASFFQRQKVKLSGDAIEREVIDGAFADKKYLDGSSPLPLAIDYLRLFKTKANAPHNLVVFDNGASSLSMYLNKEYRDSIKLGDEGSVTINEDGVVINVFVLSTAVTKEQFERWMYDHSDAHWSETETMIVDSIKGKKKDLFERAVKTIKENI